MAQPVRLPSIKELPLPVGRRADIVRPYVESSLRIGRHPDRFVLLLLGETGHGKTKTINRLINNNLLEVAQRCAGTTTKVVQRVNVPITFDSEGNRIELTVSFDDTPGFGDTISDDRERNQALLARYVENHFPNFDESQPAHPNVILIVTSWDTVKEDDNHPPSIDKTIQYLRRSRLVDNKRGNVIVVVTKSLSFWNDYEDASSQRERELYWREDAEKKKWIINGLRSKAFAGSDSEWPVVFVENGGGTSANPRRLPNEESYPENLFEAIKTLVCLAGPDQPHDLVGAAALLYLTGGLQPSGHSSRQILVGDGPEDAPNPAKSSDVRLADPTKTNPRGTSSDAPTLLSMLMRSSVDGVWPLLKTLGNNDGNSNTPPAHIYLVQPVRLPSIKELKELPLHDRREADIVRPYVESSRSIGRHPDRFILLLLGETGHGKTKTVNRLIDNDLLEVARPCAGTTTKVVQRVDVPITFDSEGNRIELTVSFDDTPGFGDTIFSDRVRNQALLDRYAHNHFPTLDESQQTYPNVILIVASWDSVKEDHDYPPSIDKTIQYLSRSRLVDNKRGNVVVVVTKSLSFWNDYEDASSQKKKEIYWREDAEKKKSIINGLRSKAFAGSDSEWPVVFVENGGGTSVNPRRLPNEESYSQNLFNAIQTLVFPARPDEPHDLVGAAALQYLTGVLQPSGDPSRQILI